MESEAGRFQAGEKLLPERELAQKLEISRNSAREGLRILENMGVLESQQGAGNYVSGNFDEILAEMLSFMYILKKIDVDKITEFRSTLEWGAIETGVKQATEEPAPEDDVLSRQFGAGGDGGGACPLG